MRWRVANFCCQQRGWSLAGNLLNSDGDAVRRDLIGNSNPKMNSQIIKFFK